MPIERKTFPIEIKEISESGALEGYLSVFGNIDEGGDIVEKGAFKKTIKEKKTFPLLWHHNSSVPDLVVGTFKAEEDVRGLAIRAEFFDDEDSQKARRKVQRLQERGVMVGLSIGYRAIKWAYDTIEGRTVRRLKEIALDEGSITLFPMNQEALVESVKSLIDRIDRLEEEKAEWTAAFINSLPDAAFAVIEPAYKNGDTEDKRARHLPHHKKNVSDPDDDDSVDLPHLRNALARMNQVKPVTDSISAEELRKKATKHLIGHAKRLGIGDYEDTDKSISHSAEEPPEGTLYGEPLRSPLFPVIEALEKPGKSIFSEALEKISRR
ncbi:MAG TPA: HK97 family phage prohead protease [Candidatus Saccharicenans sp.]|nr:HK97 family phage prohead protease [Candidatus Saccharicenans sp.]